MPLLFPYTSLGARNRCGLCANIVRYWRAKKGHVSFLSAISVTSVFGIHFVTM